MRKGRIAGLDRSEPGWRSCLAWFTMSLSVGKAVENPGAMNPGTMAPAPSPSPVEAELQRQRLGR